MYPCVSEDDVAFCVFLCVCVNTSRWGKGFRVQKDAGEEAEKKEGEAVCLCVWCG